MNLSVGELMTEHVFAVREETGYKELASFMRRNHVNALPVVEAGNRVVGVVSTADLLTKLADPDPEDGYMAEPFQERLDRIKSVGTRVRDLMTAPAVTVTAGAAPREAAALMRDRRLKRLPVADDDGRLVGIVSRSDLLRVYEVPDEELQRSVAHDIVRERFGLAGVETEVRRGVVTLTGEVPQRSDIPRLAHAVRAVEGVVRVDCRLSYEHDDLLALGAPV